jgi:hypothetical protein
MKLSLRRVAGSIGILATALAAAVAYPPLRERALEMREQERTAREFEQRLALELHAHSSARQAAELFPHGR